MLTLAIIGAAIADANDRDDRVVTRNTTRTFDDTPKNWHRQEKARGRLLARELEWIRMTPKARQTKSKARIKRYQEMLDEQPES